jgi:signal transduction histidine kinase
VISDATRALWAEPRVPDPPARVWRDWVVLAAVACAFMLENVLRADMPWRPVTFVEIAVLAIALLRRRTDPLGAVALGFGLAILVDVASLVAGASGTVSPYSMAFLLILPYSLFRWGSGREAVIGSGIMLAGYVSGLARDHSNLIESAIGLVILVFPAAIGTAVRFWSTSRTRELDQVRLREREQLARELHDTVAHHVSAMVIRAQAGRVVAEAHPEAAVDALRIIEAEGSRTLAEMRTMVAALRDRDEAEMAPRGGVADIEGLAQSMGERQQVEVRKSGDLEDLSATVDAAIYRITQESLTNAMRHARHSTRVEVQVDGDDDCVRLTVRDDGDPVPAGGSMGGYGIVGMRERATLLGGTFEAGPGRDRGWVVTAMLPRSGATA